MKTKSKVKKPKKSSKRKESIPAYLQDSINKNRDNLGLLISYPKFQKEIENLRTSINIPAEGFTGKDADQKRTQWYKWFYKKSDEISNNKYFYKELRDINKKEKEKEISHSESIDLKEELHSDIPINTLTMGIKNLIKKFHLPANYVFSIHQYIMHNKPVSQGLNYAIVTNTKNTFPILEIYTKLTDTDLRSIKEDINNFFGINLPAYKNTDNIATGLEIEKLSGKEESDYADGTSYKLKDEDVAERVLGSAKKKNEIPKIKRNLKDLRRKRFTVL